MCSRNTCSSCSKADECGWCTTSNAVAVGDCIALSEAATCSTSLVTEKDQCPSVGGDVILKNITGMLGAMIGVAIILNVYNRVSNRRRKKKLQHSIFELPVYVYTAPTRKRAKAATLARLQAQGEEAAPSDPTPNVEAVGSSPAAPASSSCSGSWSSSSSSSSENGDEESVVTCTVCLAAYEEDEVIKVLPCGHDFHSSCLDSWLEQKATCPLCMAPAFAKLRDQDRTSDSQASTQGLRQQPDAAPPLFTPPDQEAQSSLGGDARSGGTVDGGPLLARPGSPPPPGTNVDGGLLLVRPASPLPPETNGEADVDGSLPLSEAGRPGEAALETARREEEEEGATAVSAMAMAMAVEEGGAGAGAQKDGAVSEETIAVVDADIQVGAGDGASGASGSVAGDDGDEGPAPATHPSGASSPSYHGGDTIADAATSHVTPRRADRVVSLTELEKGQAGPAKAAVVVANVTVDTVDPDRVVAGGDIAVGAVGHDERIGAAAGGDSVDVEGGRSGVAGHEDEAAAVAFQV